MPIRVFDKIHYLIYTNKNTKPRAEIGVEEKGADRPHRENEEREDK